jgi:hypothetical protein
LVLQLLSLPLCELSSRIFVTVSAWPCGAPASRSSRC